MYTWSWYFDLAAWLHPFIHIECQGFGSEADLSCRMMWFACNIFIIKYLRVLADAMDAQDTMDDRY